MLGALPARSRRIAFNLTPLNSSLAKLEPEERLDDDTHHTARRHGRKLSAPWLVSTFGFRCLLR